MKKNILKFIIIGIYGLFLAYSFIFNNKHGIEIGKNFYLYMIEMIKVLPSAFILIGLFEVWIKKETVEKHMGSGSVFSGFIWAILLAGTTVGGLLTSFPVAVSLYKKGAKLSVIFCYISSSAICRIPMAVFEASFLGLKFTLIRLMISIPLVIISSILLGNYFEKKEFKIINN